MNWKSLESGKLGKEKKKKRDGPEPGKLGKKKKKKKTYSYTLTFA